MIRFGLAWLTAPALALACTIGCSAAPSSVDDGAPAAPAEETEVSSSALGGLGGPLHTPIGCHPACATGSRCCPFPNADGTDSWSCKKVKVCPVFEDPSP